MPTDPWEQAAQEFKSSGQKPAAAAPASGDDDWKIWQANGGGAPQQLPTFGKIQHGLENFAEAVNPLPMVSGLASSVMHPIDTVKSLVNTSGEQANRAIDEFKHGNVSSGIAHSLAAVPLVGSGLVKPLHQMEEENDPVGGMGTLLGTAATAGLAHWGSGEVGAAAEGLAEPLAETALRIPSKTKAFGATPGRALIRDTSGVKPADIAASAQSKLGQLNSDLNTAVGASGNPVDLTPARTRISSARSLAQTENTPTINRQLIPLQNTLERDFTTKQPIPSLVTPRHALDLKRGFGKEHTEFNPNVSDEVNNVAKSAYHDLGASIHQAVPGANDIDQRISSLIPVQKAASKLALDPTTGQKIMIRIANPTARILGPTVGGYFGGLPGAAAGLVLPELLTNPTAQIFAARKLNTIGRGLQSPLAKNVARAVPLVRVPDDQQ